MVRRRFIFAVLLSLSACAAHAQTPAFIQASFTDATNPTATLGGNSTHGNAIIAVAGCNTVYNTCDQSNPTDNEGNTYNQISTCIASTVSDSATRTRVYAAYNIVGGTHTAVSTVGTNVQFVIAEVSNVDTLDQQICGTGDSTAGGTASSGVINTTHAVEMVIGMGTDIFGGFSGNCVAPWNAITFGSQVACYQVASSTGAYNAQAPVNTSADGTWALAAVSFYKAPASSAFQPDEDYFLQFTVGLIVAMVYAMSGTKKQRSPARLLLADPTFRFIRAIPHKQKVRLLQ